MDVPDALRNGPTLIALFAVLALASTAGTVLALGGSVNELLYALAGGIAIAVVVIGSYAFGRRYGQPHSHAVAQAGIMFGMTVLFAIVADLLISAGVLSQTEIALGLGGAVVGVAGLILIIGFLDRLLSPA